MQKFNHGSLGIKHAFIHIDVDDLRAIINLGKGNLQSCIVVFLNNQAGELLGTGDIGSFTDVNE